MTDGDEPRLQVQEPVGDVFDWDDIFGFRAERESRNRDEQRLHGARDMWPLLVDK